MARADVLLVSLGSTAGLRAADVELAGAFERAGADVALVAARAPREVRTLVLTDLGWARGARAAARAGIATHDPRAILYSTTTAALLWPAPGAIRFDAPSAANRPGRHGVWQRPLERRRLRTAPLLVPWALGSLDETPSPHGPGIVVPVPVEPSRDETPSPHAPGIVVPVPVEPSRDEIAAPPAPGIVVPVPVEPSAPGADDGRDIAAITYGANPHKKGLDRVLAAWATARRGDEELVVAGTDRVPATPGVRDVGRLAPAAYRALLRRARVFVTAPRREDYGIAQLEALADGCALVTTAAPGPYAALPLARALDPRLVPDDGDDGLAVALRTALDDVAPDYAERAAAAIAPYRRAAADRVVAEELLPRLLGQA